MRSHGTILQSRDFKIHTLPFWSLDKISILGDFKIHGVLLYNSLHFWSYILIK